MKIKESDLKAIEASVKKAESQTRAEIVPVLVSHSAGVSHVAFSIASLLCLIYGLALAIYLNFNHPSLSDSDWGASTLGFEIMLPLFLCMAIGLLLAKFDFFQRLFTSKHDMARAVDLRAELEFYRCSVNKTEEHVGVLIFASLMERRSVVLADKGIAEKLPPETWNQILKTLNTNIKASNVAAGFVPAIEQCASILARNFPKVGRDKDELSDSLVVRED